MILDAAVVISRRSSGVSSTETAPRFVSLDAYTPKHLAERILTSKAALEGERKQVTVLFVDVSGFTTLSEKLDPEDIHQLMRFPADLTRLSCEPR